MFWKWAETGDPTLAGHGSLQEIKNKGAAPSDPIIVESFFDNNSIKMEIEFEDMDKAFGFAGSNGVGFDQAPFGRNEAGAQFKLNPYKKKASELPFMSYVSADRWGPRVSLPMFTFAGDLNHVGEYGQYAIDFLSRNERAIVPNLLRHPNSQGDTLKYNVRAWLEEIAPNIEFKHGTDKQRDMAFATINDFRPTNTGFGLSYTLPIIIILLGMAATMEDSKKQKEKALRGALVLLENPEAHIHPKGQTSIGKLISLAAACGVQVIVETHSDHLMDGIRIAVKEGELNAEDAAFHYFTSHLTPDKNRFPSTVVETPKIDSNGKLTYWPKGFFDQTMHNCAILARR